MRLLSIFLFSIISIFAFGQISQGGQPLINSLPSNQYHTEGISNLNELIAEDAITDSQKDIPWRFGVEIPTQLDVLSQGRWDVIGNTLICKLEISSPNAVSINLNYSKFKLAPKAKLFIFDEKKGEVLGAFTSENNSKDGTFATNLVYSDKIILQYEIPADNKETSEIIINGIVHGYRSLKSGLKNFGASGFCNRNVVCDSTLWQDDARSVVMLLTSSNTRYCSGALVNNTKNDGTPYVLSAFHCSVGANSIFMFNYFSAQCGTSIDGNTTQTISGCQIKASNTTSDFILVKLNSTPPLSYNPFYAGWNADTLASYSSTGIHHPRGDVKKISHDYDPAVSSGYYNPGNDHWKVKDWDLGTTEPVSSGSPLFDHNHRITGQLHGGNAACGNDFQDYYGKFSLSWDLVNDTTRQLKYWLDPDSTGTKILDPYSPTTPSKLRDAAMLTLTNIEAYSCKDSISPIISFRNFGADTLKTLTIFYQLDNNPTQFIAWAGALRSYAVNTLSLPKIHTVGGNHILKVYTSGPNGNTDQNNFNDTIIKSFFTNDQPNNLTLTVRTDDYGSETSWAIIDNQNQVVHSGGPYENKIGGETLVHSICLANECYQFVIKDAVGDGMCCAYGKGYYLLTNDLNGDTLAFDTNFTTTTDTQLFCLDTCKFFITSQITNSTTSSSNDGSIDVTVNGNKGPVSYIWSTSDTTEDISGLAPGVYTLIVTDSVGCSDTISFTVSFGNAINELSSNQVSIYPNPFNDMLYLKTDLVGNHKLRVFGLLGQEILNQNIYFNNEVKEIDVQFLGKGVYLLEISNSKQSIVKKLVKR